MVIERTVYDCAYCQKTYSRKEDAQHCEATCAKLSGSPDISVLNLSTRTYNSLKIAGIDTVQELLDKTDSDLLRIKNFGKVCLRDLNNQLQPFGELRKETTPKHISVNHQKNLELEDFQADDQWINRSSTLPLFLETQVTEFLEPLGWADLYVNYQWHNDTWDNGFPGIFKLETQMQKSLQNSFITREDILKVIHRGDYYPFSFSCPESIPMPNIIQDEITLLQTLNNLEQNINRIGVTYFSKILRFAYPYYAGGIDSNIIRVFGLGDPTVNQYQWLTLRVRNLISGWIAFRSKMWHSEFLKWQLILSKIVSLLLESSKLLT
jgi:DNA-directed RNA polymerase subunit alpha